MFESKDDHTEGEAPDWVTLWFKRTWLFYEHNIGDPVGCFDRDNAWQFEEPMSEKDDDMPEWPQTQRSTVRPPKTKKFFPKIALIGMMEPIRADYFAPICQTEVSIVKSTRITRSQRRRMNAEMRGAGARSSFVSGRILEKLGSSWESGRPGFGSFLLYIILPCHYRRRGF